MSELVKSGIPLKDGRGFGDRLQASRDQRDQALACAWLSLVLAIAIVLSTFGTPSRGLAVALTDADELRSALANDAKALSSNEQALRETQAALAALKARMP